MQMQMQPPPQVIVVQAGPAQWQSGICDFSQDCGFCLLATCFPCWAYGKNKELMGEGCCGGCLLFLLTAWCGVALCLTCSNRGTIRGRYNIEGGCVGDCFAHWCCFPCALTQEHIQLEKVPFNQTTVVTTGVVAQPNVFVQQPQQYHH